MAEMMLAAAAAYLIGSVPSGFLIGKYVYHVNLKKMGSCNIGATNAYRILGMKAAVAVFLCDFLKGMLAVYIGKPEAWTMVLCAFMAIVGNNWSVFLKFKSGRGVACGVGAFCYLCPWAALAAFLVWLAVFAVGRIVSLASLIATPVVPLVLFLLHEPVEYIIFASLAAALIIVRHKDNIRRLLRGEEKKIVREKR